MLLDINEDNIGDIFREDLESLGIEDQFHFMAALAPMWSFYEFGEIGIDKQMNRESYIAMAVAAFRTDMHMPIKATIADLNRGINILVEKFYLHETSGSLNLEYKGELFMELLVESNGN